MRSHDVADVLIVGAGPAGLSAALQLRRQGIAPLVLTDSSLGGLLRNAHLVENYLGFPQGISGLRLAQLMAEQVERSGLSIIRVEVLELDHEADSFRATTTGGVYQARLAVIASGTKPIKFTQFVIPVAWQEYVLYEITPILAAAGKRIVIVGAGDAACDYALNLGQRNDVLILNRGRQVKCLPVLWQRIHDCPRITYCAGLTVSEIRNDSGTEMVLTCTGPNRSEVRRADYLIGALGREPQLDFLTPALQKRAPLLKRKGILHFVGDVKNGKFRQAAVAVGDGLLAALRIGQYLRNSRPGSPVKSRTGRVAAQPLLES